MPNSTPPVSQNLMSHTGIDLVLFLSLPICSKVMSDALMLNDTLQKINLSFNHVSDEHIENQCPGLVRNAGLEALWLWGGAIAEKGTCCLVQVLEQAEHLSLKDVDIPGVAIKGDLDPLGARCNAV